MKDVGWTGFSVNDALTPLSNMGQILYEPPDVAGWDAGQTWFSTGAMLARMNFASTLAANQKFNLAQRGEAAGTRKTPEALLAYCSTIARDRAARLERHRGAAATTCAPPARGPAATRSCRRRSSGLVHLMAGSPEYQLV